MVTGLIGVQFGLQSYAWLNKIGQPRNESPICLITRWLQTEYFVFFSQIMTE